MYGVAPTPHSDWNENRINVSHAGRTAGMTMRKSVVVSVLPSMRAASSRLVGTPSMYCRIKNSPSDEAAAGRMIAHALSIRPKRLMMM